MADFCKACSIDMFGKDFGELAGLCPEPDVASTICEGCGPVLVNRAGEYLSTNCLCKGQDGHGVRHPAFTDSAGNAVETPVVEARFGPGDDGEPTVTAEPTEGPLHPRGWTPDDL